MWVIRIVGVIVLGNSLNLGIAGVWLAIGIDLYTRSAFCPIVLKRNIRRLTEKKEAPTEDFLFHYEPVETYLLRPKRQNKRAGIPNGKHSNGAERPQWLLQPTNDK